MLQVPRRNRTSSSAVLVAGLELNRFVGETRALGVVRKLADTAVITRDFTNSTPMFNGGSDFNNLSNDHSLIVRGGAIANVDGTDIDLVATVTGGGYKARMNHRTLVSLRV